MPMICCQSNLWHVVFFISILFQVEVLKFVQVRIISMLQVDLLFRNSKPPSESRLAYKCWLCMNILIFGKHLRMSNSLWICALIRTSLRTSMPLITIIICTPLGDFIQRDSLSSRELGNPLKCWKRTTYKVYPFSLLLLIISFNCIIYSLSEDETQLIE